jgi:hypothetical protein
MADLLSSKEYQRLVQSKRNAKKEENQKKKSEKLSVEEALEQVILFCELDEETTKKARFVIKQLILSNKI